MRSSFAVVESETGPPAEDQESEFDTILYHITHDLLASLRAIRTLPCWIREDMAAAGVPSSSAIEENLQLLEIQTARADRMLHDLRTYSRVGRVSGRPGLQRLADVIAEACESATVPDAFSVEVTVGALQIPAGRNDLCTLFEALLSNAVKHHHAETGVIRISARPEGTTAIIAVEDDGPGIEPKFRERVFEMMSTLRSRDEVEGSGLGLAICQKICTLLGGTIRVADPLELDGTRIEMRLPCGPEPVARPV